MATKVLVLILAIGVCAVALLSMRQARLQAAHDIARALERIQQIEHDRWAARARLAAVMDPARLAQVVAVDLEAEVDTYFNSASDTDFDPLLSPESDAGLLFQPSNDVRRDVVPLLQPDEVLP